jgi:hypothetical protein
LFDHAKIAGKGYGAFMRLGYRLGAAVTVAALGVFAAAAPGPLRAQARAAAVRKPAAQGCAAVVTHVELLTVV